MSDMDEVVGEFLVESHENLDQLDRDLLALEAEPDSPATIASIFRTIHTIKGTCGFLGFSNLERVTHVGENLLSRLRDGELRFDGAMATALLALSDVVRTMLAEIEATGADGDADHTDLLDLLTRLRDGEEAPSPPPAPAPAPEPEAAPASEPTPVVPAPVPLPKLGEILVERGIATPEQIAAAVAKQLAGDTRRLGEILVDHGVSAEQIDEALAKQGEARHAGSIAETSIRVDVGLLDDLMTLVGELVLARNQIVQLTQAVDDTELQATTQRLNLITTELQEGAMKTRMQPVGTVWSKLPRLVRDVAVGCGKKVRIETEGEDTELDKSIIEAIKDPLTHLVRNAVDHGVEAPEARVAHGKPEEGRLLLRAWHEGGQVNIELSDDGQGIDPARIRAKAVEKGLVTADWAAAMSDREVLDLIFAAGFSTAEKITNVSGRGVGMDVVRTHIEKIGGSVDVTSLLGSGTAFRIKIPLTLAIIPALVVESDGDRFAIPQVSLLELVRLDGDQVTSGIEDVHGAPVHRLRGRLLPLVDLRSELGQAPADVERDVVNIVVLQAEDRQFGLVVDHISDSAEIVVKPLGQHLKGIPTFAGATIMGDGHVALILDVLGLAQRAKVVREAGGRHAADGPAAPEPTADARTALLLFATPDDGRMAMPLSLVDRLEELPLHAVERSGDRDVVQHRGAVLPLVDLARVLPERRLVPRTAAGAAERDRIQVIVHDGGTGPIGLVVERILDIVDDTVAVHPGGRHGSLGTVVVHGRVTEVIDLPAVLATAGLLVPEHA